MSSVWAKNLKTRLSLDEALLRLVANGYSNKAQSDVNIKLDGNPYLA